MYKDKCVLSIIDSNDLILTENNGTCKLPFESEYKIRLKNKNIFSVLASVTIDGKSITTTANSGIVLDSFSSIDLERWIDSLNKGNKFKFVSVDHEESQDPYNEKNGIIEVSFYKERTINYFNNIGKIKPNDSGQFIYPPVWTCNDGLYGQNFQTYCSTNNNSIKPNSFNTNESGCTINGSISDQSFSYSNIEFYKTAFCSLSLKLIGYNVNNINNLRINFCSVCGKRRQKNDNFCSKCGTKLI